MKKLIWLGWGVVTIGIATYYLSILFAKEDKSEFLIGEATHGHYQIELACSSCHTEPFGGEDILQDACMNCHEQELSDAFDSHPKKKFTNPRNADLIDVIDARYCVSCHTEHQAEQTLEMGLTLPNDYCYHCHQDIGDERPSHKNLAFDSCATAGCHNFHDNRALYEAFLVENANKPWIKEIATLTQANHAHLNAAPAEKMLSAPAHLSAAHPHITEEWSATAHAEAGVACASCHEDEQASWIAKPTITVCQNCHDKEAEGFLAGKHGMRLVAASDAISPQNARLTFHSNANQAHGCNSCHSAHEFNRQTASAESCLGCHADEHSLAFTESPHGKLWAAELSGDIGAGEGVNCATCHMPRIAEKKKGAVVVRVEHNQNLTLRPNEKMIRPVCMQCHSLEFSIDALADEDLIKNNFNSSPSKHIPSIDWALKRDKRE